MMKNLCVGKSLVLPHPLPHYEAAQYDEARPAEVYVSIYCTGFSCMMCNHTITQIVYAIPKSFAEHIIREVSLTI